VKPSFSPSLVADTIWKTAILLSVFFMLGAGLVWFNAHRLTLEHQHPYFTRMYVGVAEYRLEHLFDWLKPGSSQASSHPPATARSVPVLLYHGVRPGPDGENVSAAAFTNQMLALKNAGWQTISIEDYYEFMRQGKKLPEKSFLLTFDDGRKDSYYPVDPLLQTLHYRATMFVITKASLTPTESKFYLDQTELLEMRDSGRWDLQPHAAFGHFYYAVDAKGTQGHFYDNKLWLSAQNRLETNQEFADRVLGDLKMAKSDLAQAVASSGIAFAYPFNEFGANTTNYPAATSVLQTAVQSQFPIAFYQVWPNRGSTQNFPQDPNFMQKRLLMDSTTTPQNLLAQLNDSSAKPFNYSNDLQHHDNSWLKSWGDMTWTKSGLSLKAAKNGDGAFAFLDGAMDWHDYTATARTQLSTGAYTRIFGRMVDDKNHLSCTYTPGQVILEQTVNNSTHTLAKADFSSSLGDVQVGIRTHGTQVDCLENAQVVTSATQEPNTTENGSIGFAVWNPPLGTANLEVSDVKVTP